MQKMILSDQRTKHLVENNPQIAHALKDPNILNDIFKMLTDKQAYAEMMRGHDRQLSNLENLPQGFQQLQKLYHDMDIISENRIISASAQKLGIHNLHHVIRIPVPNPWINDNYQVPATGPFPSKNKKSISHSDISFKPAIDTLEQQVLVLKDMGFTDENQNRNVLMEHKDFMTVVDVLTQHKLKNDDHKGKNLVTTDTEESNEQQSVKKQKRSSSLNNNDTEEPQLPENDSDKDKDVDGTENNHKSC